MSPDRDATTADIRSGDDSPAGDEPGVLLFMRPGRDRSLLVDTLGERYEVETTTDVATLETAYDCCIFDAHEFDRVAGTVQSRRDTGEAVFLPFVLLVGEESGNVSKTEAWQYVDDVIELPVKRTALLSRIGNLVERRRTAAELAEREAELERTVEDLKLKERAMDEAPIGITITEPGPGDNPLVYANDQFRELTGYSTGRVGEDCRFLQGEETDPETRATIREAIDSRQSVSVDILNYRKNGQKFWNRLSIAPIHDGDGGVRNFVGFQVDITDRKIRERRLEVLNRVLSHNLRNKMNVIEGYTSMLRSDGDGEPSEYVVEIEKATRELMGLAEAVQKIDAVSAPGESTNPIRLDERLAMLVSAFDDRYPDAAFDVTLPEDGPTEVAVTGLMTAVREAVENAVEHNDDPEPSVEIAVDSRADGWVDIDITDDGPGIPDREVEVLRGGETPLNHADRLGLWLIYWVINKVGGEFDVSTGESRGTTLHLSVPACE
ncbi:PAS domain-containing protein [Halostella salina]|uniref:PAS domain-containing protein n=1 Tax=Halostella salina TaxID=1547897 RepID=UPI000EF814BC|nr:PAS domain-containing protein [Halostella salina]